MESRHALRLQAKVVPERFRTVNIETIDAIRAITGTISNAEELIAKSTATLGIGLPIQMPGQR